MLAFEQPKLSTTLFNLQAFRFSFISDQFLKYGGFGQEYLLKSVNKNTNIAVPGKVNFFSLNSTNFCSFNYYFKKFKRRRLKPLRVNRLKKSIKLIKRTLIFRRLPNGKLEVRSFSNHDRWLKKKLPAMFRRKNYRRLYRLKRYTHSTPFAYKHTILEARNFFYERKATDLFSKDFIKQKLNLKDQLPPVIKSSALFSKSLDYSDVVGWADPLLLLNTSNFRLNFKTRLSRKHTRALPQQLFFNKRFFTIPHGEGRRVFGRGKSTFF